MEKEITQKLELIQALLKQKEEIDKKLSDLLKTETKIALPPEFSINDEVLSLVMEVYPNSISRKELIKKINYKFPTYNIEKKQVASALAYLKNYRKEVDIPNRGFYKFIQKTA